MFYRDRWSHDKVVRSTHGVNCTGSCSWKVYVKDGIITWGDPGDRLSRRSARTGPEYEPRGLPARCGVLLVHLFAHGARYPYARGVLVEMYRRPSRASAIRCWRGPTSRPIPSAAAGTNAARGKGGLVRVTWAEATEMIAAAHVHTIRPMGRTVSPASRRSRRCRWSATPPDPGSSTARRGDDVVLRLVCRPARGLAAGVRRSDRCAGVRGLVGRVVSDDVGSNVPVTRTPGCALDGRGALPRTKVVSVSPDYADNTKFADEWMPCAAGTDGALAMAMGHVILSECLRSTSVSRSSSTTCAASPTCRFWSSSRGT